MDLDGHGRLSLLSGSNCCDGCGFFLFRRTADGSWEPRKRLNMVYPDKHKPFRQETFVTAADWDGDGVVDLLGVGNQGGIGVALGELKGAGPVVFTREVELPRGEASTDTNWVHSFAVTDWDREGMPGFLVHHIREDRTQGIYWYKNLGGPGLTRLATGKLILDIPPAVSVMGFCVGDWNGDGWLDLIMTRAESMRKDTDGSPTDWRSSVWVYLRE